jgi:hypothetical protein
VGTAVFLLFNALAIRAEKRKAGKQKDEGESFQRANGDFCKERR